ncbi:MAG: ROK family protein, partial [Acidimicrobiia bacterium]|nr:ROK family protein [Acidimicrobiia bacterium]
MILSGPVALAVDIGGTKIDVGIVDRDGVILARKRAVTPAHGTGDDMFGVIVE